MNLYEASQQEAILKISHLDLFYGSHHALKNVSLNIPANSITALIGPSGCGKSTFIRTLNRMNDLIPGVKVTGDIRLDGQDIYREGMSSAFGKRWEWYFKSPTRFRSPCMRTWPSAPSSTA